MGDDQFGDNSPKAEVLVALWAKSSESFSNGHPLLAHMLDVAAVAESLLFREPASTRRWVATHLGVTEADAPRWGGLFAGLHDFGKATPGFEAKWPPGMDRLASLGLDFSWRTLDRHDIATAALVDRHCHGRLPDGLLTGVCEALSAHHGFFPALAARQPYRAMSQTGGWPECRETLLDAYWDALAPPSEPRGIASGFAFTLWLAGLVSVADWIGSTTDFFPMGWRGEDPQAHHRRGLDLAKAALERIGWPQGAVLRPDHFSTAEALSTIVGRKANPRPLQQAGWELLEGVTSPVLMIVEAPMGEGKTELAFLAHLRLQASLGHRGLYVALPTQATGNAMFQRSVRFLEAMRPGTALDIQLAHGGAGMNPELKRLRIATQESTDAVSSSAWFSKRRRALLSPYGVGTVDQLLLGVLNVKHHFVRLFGLANRVVVLDEVHAYDVYTSGLILGLLSWLKRLGSSVVIMSATLPAAKRQELLGAWGKAEDGVAQWAYPRIVVAQNGRTPEGRHFASREQPPIKLAPLHEDVEALAQTALGLVENGGCGAIIVNTVQRAQHVFQLLKQAPGEGVTLILYHARFPSDERQWHEQAVLGLFGPEGARPSRAILVATQVAEQSLDADFDFMLSDLAPVDLLLQRAGRLHRHARPRPEAHGAPRLFVAGLDKEAMPDLAGTAWKWVYEPAYLLRTWALLRDAESLSLPQDIDRLVQAAYAEAFVPPEGLPHEVLEALEASWAEAQGKQATQAAMAAQNIVDVASLNADEAYGTFPMVDEDDGAAAGLIALTRLGDPSVSVVPVFVECPGCWRLAPDSTPFDPSSIPDDTQAERIWLRQVRLSRRPLPDILAKTPTPTGWAGHPLLRGLKPLLLDGQGCAVFDKLTVRLDAELGVVYQKEAA